MVKVITELHLRKTFQTALRNVNVQIKVVTVKTIK